MIGVFRREFWIADDELGARLSAVDVELTRRERARRSNDDIVMPFRRDGELVAGFAAVRGVVALGVLIVAVMIR